VDDLPAGLVETDRGAHHVGELEKLVPVAVERRPGPVSPMEIDPRTKGGK
jgi:hypothetical protein